MSFSTSSYTGLDEGCRASEGRYAQGRPSVMASADMLTQASGGGRSEKECGERRRLGASQAAHAAARRGRARGASEFESPSFSKQPAVCLSPASVSRALFVVSVQPGREHAISDRIMALAGPALVKDCFSLAYQILKKNQGSWRLYAENMFPGYLFVATDDIKAVQERLKLSPSSIRFLGAERRVFALRAEEEAFIRDFGGTTHVIGMSRGIIRHGAMEIGEGPLRGRADLIKKIDRHKRIAYLDLGVLNQPQVKVGLEIVSKT